jgi:hypothetical protein
VQTSEGEPVQGAEVKAEGAPAVLTDASGFYDIPSVPMKPRPVAVTSSCDGYRTRKREIYIHHDDIEMRIALARVAPIFGRVVDLRGKPVPNVYVTVSRAEPGVMTGADGAFRFDDAPAGACEVTLNPVARREWRGPGRLVVSSSDCPLVVRFEAVGPGPATFVLDLVDGSGKPVPVSSASLVPVDDALHPRTTAVLTAQADGTLEASGLQLGTYLLHVRTKDELRFVRRCRIASAGTMRTRLVLGTPGTIVGRVRFDGVPPENSTAFVVGTYRGKTAYPVAQEITSVDPRSAARARRLLEITGSAVASSVQNGGFRLHDVPSLPELEVRLAGPYCIGSAKVTVPPGGVVEVEIRAKPVGILRFSFDGSAAQDLGLSLARKDAPFEDEQRVYYAPGQGWAPRLQLEAGDWRWRLRSYDLHTGELRVKEGDVTVVAGKTVDVPVSLR